MDIADRPAYDFLGSALLEGCHHQYDTALPDVKAKKASRKSTASNSSAASKAKTKPDPKHSPSPSPSPPPGKKIKGKAETGARPSEIRAKRIREEQKIHVALQKCNQILQLASEQTFAAAKLTVKMSTSEHSKLMQAKDGPYLDLCRDEGSDQLQGGLELHAQATNLFVAFRLSLAALFPLCFAYLFCVPIKSVSDG